MIAYLNGQIVSIEENSVIIEVGNIGYEVFMPYTHGLAPATIGESVRVYVFEHIKEDAYDLYGFINKVQKNLFKKLISVNGIGPKSALQILNMYPDDELMQIILNADSKALSKVSGIGPKTAQRVILELKDSMSKMVSVDLDALTFGLAPEKEDHQEEAIEALGALGYQQAEARKAVKAIFDYEDDTETLIKKALQLLMG
ncbi:MAG: Holliday junction branch migration protein RuvA [Cellulosilyticaceae bacterium]